MKLGFLGAGNMAEALISGMLKSNAAKPGDVTVFDVRNERIAELIKKYGIKGSSSAEELVTSSETIVLAVKPKDIDELASSLKKAASDTLIITILAGISTSYIENIAGYGNNPVIRVMPNTPALVLSGVSGIAKGNKAGKEHMKIALKILTSVGKAVEVEESLMDTVTAVSGSGPAYVFLFVEAFMEAAVKAGLDKDIARILVYNTLMGGAKMVLETGEEPEVLREKVTSKGGTTAAALKVLEDNKFKEMFSKAVEAAKARSKEMTK